MKAPVFESLFNKVAGRWPSHFIKKETPPQVFSGEICEILRTPILKNICEQLLLPLFMKGLTLRKILLLLVIPPKNIAHRCIWKALYFGKRLPVLQQRSHAYRFLSITWLFLALLSVKLLSQINPFSTSVSIYSPIYFLCQIKKETPT